MEGSPFARGRTAEIFDLVDGRALKLYLPEFGAECTEREWLALERAHAQGLRVPWPAERATVDGRHGLAMPRLLGANGMDRLLADVGRLEEDALELAGIHRSVHACSGAGLPERKSVLNQGVRQAPGLTEGEKAAIIGMLADLPEGEAMLHGDFHPGNLVWVDRTPWIVDWIDACRGAPEADVARSLVLFGHGSPEAEPDRLRYRKVYAEAMGCGRGLERWVLASAAARLAEGASSAQPYLLGWVRTEVRRLLG